MYGPRVSWSGPVTLRGAAGPGWCATLKVSDPRVWETGIRLGTRVSSAGDVFEFLGMTEFGPFVSGCVSKAGAVRVIAVPVSRGHSGALRGVQEVSRPEGVCQDGGRGSVAEGKYAFHLTGPHPKPPSPRGQNH